MIQNVDVSAEKTPRKMKRSYKVVGVLLGLIVIYIVSGAIFCKIGMPAFMFKYEKNDKGGITITDYLGPYLQVHIPDKIEGLEVTEIGYHAFSADYDSNSAKTRFNRSVCRNIREVIIPGTVEKIGTGAFSHCYTLYNIDFPSSLRKTGVDIFAFSGIKEIEIPEGMTKIGYYAFGFSNSLEKVTLPDSIEEIDIAAFADCNNLKEINVPARLKRVGFNSFDDTALTDEQIQAFCDKAEEVIG